MSKNRIAVNLIETLDIANSASSSEIDRLSQSMKASAVEAFQKARGFMPAVSYYLKTKQSSLKRSSYQSQIECLQVGFIAFLILTNKCDLTLAEFDEMVINDFIYWLDSRMSKNGTNEQPLLVSTKAGLYNTFVRVIKCACTHPDFGAAAKVVHENFIPANPWEGYNTQRDEPLRLSTDELAKIQLAAEKEIFAIGARLADVKDRIRHGQSLLETSVGKRVVLSRHPDCLLAYIHSHYPGALPTRAAVERDHPLTKWAFSRYRFDEIERDLYCSTRELVPFMVLLTIASALNLGSITGMRIADVNSETIFGVRHLTIKAPKYRSNQSKVHKFKCDLERMIDLEKIIGLLFLYTRRLRVSDDPISEYVFIAKVERFANVACHDNLEGTKRLQLGLKSFLKQHHLPPTNIRQIRFSVIDEEALITGSMEYASTLARHKSKDTTFLHYLSHRTKAGFKERLGYAMQLRDRFNESKGRIDPRGIDSTSYQLASTPGFSCLDPYDSPMPLQKKGRLCNAFGRCPICPLVRSNPNAVSDVAAWQALKRRVLEMAWTSSWAGLWRPVYDALLKLEHFVAPDTLNDARRFEVRLPPLG